MSFKNQKKAAPPLTKPQKAALLTSSATAAVELPPVPLTEVYSRLEGELLQWIGDDSPYGRASHRVQTLRTDLRLAERVAAFEADKLRTMLSHVAQPDLQREAAKRWYDTDLHNLISDFALELAEGEWLENGTTPEIITNHLAVALTDEERQNAEEEEFKECLATGELAVADTGDGLVLFTGEQWSRWRRDRRHLQVEDFVLDEEDLGKEIMRVRWFVSPEQAAARKAAARKPAKSAVAPKAAAAKPVKKTKADKGAELAAAAKTTKPAAKAGITKAVLKVNKPEGWILSYRKDGHTRTKNTVVPGNKDVWLAGVCKELGINPKTVIDETGESTPPSRKAAKSSASKKSKGPKPAATKQPQVSDPFIVGGGGSGQGCRVEEDANGHWSAVFADGTRSKLDGEHDLRTALEAAMKVHDGPPRAGWSIPRLELCYLIHAREDGFALQYENLDVHEEVSTTFAAKDLTGLIKEGAEMFGLTEALFAAFIHMQAIDVGERNLSGEIWSTQTGLKVEEIHQWYLQHMSSAEAGQSLNPPPPEKPTAEERKAKTTYRLFSPEGRVWKIEITRANGEQRTQTLGADDQAAALAEAAGRCDVSPDAITVDVPAASPPQPASPEIECVLDREIPDDHRPIQDVEGSLSRTQNNFQWWTMDYLTATGDVQSLEASLGESTTRERARELIAERMGIDVAAVTLK